MSNRRKGNRTEKRCEDALIEDGWTVQRVKGSTKFNRNVDFFSLFDILALKKKDGSTRVKFVQVKTNKYPPWNPLKKFNKQFPGLECEVWTWWERGKRKTKQGWEIKKL